MRASGCAVSDWLLALPAPSQDAKKALRLRPIGRKDISRTQGSGAAEEGGEGASGERKVRREKRGVKVRVLGGKEGVFKRRKGEEEGGAEGKGKGGGKKGDGKKKRKGGEGAAGAGKGAEERPGKKAKREVALDE